MTTHTIDILAVDHRAARERQERIAFAALGLLLAGSALFSSRLGTRILLGTSGTWLVARGLTGLSLAQLSRLIENWRQPRADLERRFHDGEHDVVDAASFDSFPASDPPSY